MIVAETTDIFLGIYENMCKLQGPKGSSAYWTKVVEGDWQNEIRYLAALCKDPDHIARLGLDKNDSLVGTQRAKLQWLLATSLCMARVKSQYWHEKVLPDAFMILQSQDKCKRDKK